MSEAQVKLTTQQTHQLARLLVNFRRETVMLLLQGFDQDTRLRAETQIDELKAMGCHSDEGLLNDFADFLYFDPQTMQPSSPGILRPELRARSDRGLTLSFEQVLQWDNESLDQLLQAASPDLTIRVLTCSPQSFVERVLDRLSSEDSVRVRQQISETQSVDFSEMQKTHQQYCNLARDLMEQGLIPG
ncbi:MAG: FliG C-terminal domain-containing protein [Pirellulaceae bacterium]|nr:FliG C-terminal domain-containing protein [Pirellulaceae bacterium]